jgi:hypothetical protein
MRIGVALLLTPALALADQSAAYVLAGWSCAHQGSLGPHLVHAGFLAAVLGLTALAWPSARSGLAALRESSGFSVHRHDMMAVSAVAVGALSAAIIVAMWIPQWVLSPCFG